MFDPNFFDQEFYQAKTRLKGAKRDERSPYYKEFSQKISSCFGDTVKSILDIGGGIGNRTLNYIEAGYDAYCYDVSRWAFENSVIPDRHFCADVRDLDRVVEDPFDLVIAERVLEYFPAQDAERVLGLIDNASREWIVTSIICSDHKSPELVCRASPGRLNIAPRKFWLDLIDGLGWKLDEQKTEIMLINDWDCVWVWRR